ncbi:MAG: IS1380 family transposase [Rhodothermaceae bacterium]|nr:IS1380 family transposase [Rhodothermaceae bacterium]MYC03216.1 IS1380 family transposase [Rhodothermaceae bacterium]MYI17112.1 IS1380 family transposase [Rhodothermaceae bacterium]
MTSTTEPLFSLPFNRSILVKADSRHQTSSDAGMLLMRSVMDRTGILECLTDRLSDPRNPDRVKHPLGALLLQGQLQLIQGWDGLWAEPLRTDPVFGAATSLQRGDGVVNSDRPMASQSTLSRRLGILGIKENRAVLEAALQKLSIEHLRVRNGGNRLDEVVIDVDAMPIEVHGTQSGSAYNGHYKDTIFLPLFATCAESGDVLGAQLRPGTQREVTDCADFIVSHHDAVKKHAAERVRIRMDAGFNSGALYTRLENEGIHYLMRLKKNSVLERMAAPYLTHRALETTYHELRYQAQSWECPRRVIPVVRPRPMELFDRFYFLITNLSPTQSTGQELATTYRRRGKAEMHQGEIKAVSTWSLSSSPRPKSHYRETPIERPPLSHNDADAAPIRPENIVRLFLYLLTYQLLHIARDPFHAAAPPMEAAPQADRQVPAPSESRLDESGELVPTMGASATGEAPAPPDPVEAEAPRLHLHSFRLYLLKIGATLARHGRYAIFSIAKSAEPMWQRFWDHFQPLRWYVIPDF